MIHRLPPGTNPAAPQRHDQARRHALCALAHRLSAHRRGAHGAVQLALRAPHRRQVPAAHRGHRPRALHRARGAGDPRRPPLAGARLGRRAALPVRARQAPRRGGGGAAGQRQGLPLLPDAGRARGHAQGHRRRARAGERGEARTAGPADDPEPLARSRPEGGAGRRDAGAAPEGAARGRDRDRGPGAGPRGGARTPSSTTW